MSVDTAIKKQFLTFGKPDIGEAEEKAVCDVLSSGWLGYGSVSKRFEKEFGEAIGAKHVVAVSSCTVGLILSLKAAGIKAGDKVLAPTLTFCATLNAVLAVGAEPVLFDHSGYVPRHEGIKAIIHVHLWGDSSKFASELDGIKAIEDCAHAFGGSVGGQSLGTFGDFGVFSLYPTKNITAGDGGMVVCKTEEDAEKVRTMASQGLSKGAWSRYSDAPNDDYKVVSVGFKGIANDVASSIGLAQLRRWPEIKEKRAAIFRMYEDAFGKKADGHSQHIYEIRVKNRPMVRKKLYQEGIGTGVHYNPLHLEPAYQFLGYKKGDFPIAEKIGAETLSLPLSSTMRQDDVTRVIEAVNKIKGETND